MNITSSIRPVSLSPTRTHCCLRSTRPLTAPDPCRSSCPTGPQYLGMSIQPDEFTAHSSAAKPAGATGATGAAATTAVPGEDTSECAAAPVLGKRRHPGPHNCVSTLGVGADGVRKFILTQAQRRLRAAPDGEEKAEQQRCEQWKLAWQKWTGDATGVSAPRGTTAGDVLAEVTRAITFPDGTVLNFHRLSDKPSMWHCRNFLSEEECCELIECALSSWGGEAPPVPAVWTPNQEHRQVVKCQFSGNSHARSRALYHKLQQRVQALLGDSVKQVTTGGGPGEGGGMETQRCQICFSAPENLASVPSIGLHIDQNNGNDTRFATILVYLNDIDERYGGETVWPCAAADSGYLDPDVGKRLIDDGVTCTSDTCDIQVSATGGEVEIQARASSEAAATMDRAVREPHHLGVRVYPRQGDAVLFFSVDTDGQPDPSSWHCGLSNTNPSGKWTLQVFERFPGSLDRRSRRAFLDSQILFR